MPAVHPITPCLWFDHQAEEAANFYIDIFDRSRILHVARYTDEGHEIHGRPAGSVMTVDFELAGQPFTALNGGPHFTFSEAISLQVFCDTQAELDHYWDRLGAGGDERAQVCGWLKDRFGVSWQVSPTVLNELMRDPDPGVVQRVTHTMLRMKKLDIAPLLAAAAGDAG